MNRIIRAFRYKIRETFRIRNALINVSAAINSHSWYYNCISNAFRAEQKRVLRGINQYNKKYDLEFLLRRNTHRLEKGLTMRPRRNIFGENYIVDTVKTYAAYSETNDSDKALLDWTYNILDEYFKVVGRSKTIDIAKKTYLATNEKQKGERQKTESMPFKRSKSEKLSVEYKDLLMLSLRRRSIRWYQDKAVSREMIDSAIKVGLLAPSACNRQPFRYQIFDDQSCVKSIINIPGGTNGWSHSPPVVVAMIGQLNAFAEERDKHVVYIDASLSAMAFMYALETLGMSSCAINFPDIPEYHQKIQKYAKLKDYETTIMLIALGYADEDALVPYSAKKDLEIIREYNNEKADL